MTTSPVCKVSGCGRPVRAKERCARCYVRLLRAEKKGEPVVDPDYTQPAEAKESSVQVTLTIPVSVHDKLRGWPTEEDDPKPMPPSARARDVLIQWAKTNYPFQIPEE